LEINQPLNKHIIASPGLKSSLILFTSFINFELHLTYRPEPFSFVETKGGKAEDAFHFISYVHVNGRLYELDGLKPGPIDLGECTEDNWVSVASPIIQSRMDRFN
jgi:ubiquitin carboxyl-terminal hydrolase L5